MSLFDKLQGAKGGKISAEKKIGEEFITANGTKEGVQMLPEGVQYQVIKEGNGAKPLVTSTITAHYAGRLLNGKEFDSSYSRNQPFTARVNQLIKGWQIALPLMQEGSKWRLWIPSHLAYGDAGVPGIPGGATLDFEVELLKIVS